MFIKPNDKIGLIGLNGRGKSTLLKIINGEITIDKGSISKAKDCTIGFLNQDLLSYQSDDAILTVAMEAFKDNPEKFDLIISDMTMPSMTGDMLADEIIKIRPDIPIIICTGFSEQLSEKKINTLGIKGLLMKPLTINELAKMVRKVLDQN